MKIFLFILLGFSLSQASFANCNSSSTKSTLYNMFKVSGERTDWISVGRRDSFRRDRGLPITVSLGSGINTSVITYRRNEISLSGALICMDPDNAGAVLIEHPTNGDLLGVKRRGSTLNDSVIRLWKVGSLLETHLRPASVVN